MLIPEAPLALVDCVPALASVVTTGANMLSALLVQTADVRDTVVMVPAPGNPGVFARVVEAMRGLMTIAIVVLTFAVVPAAWNFRKSYQKISDLLDRVYADVNPITHHVGRITENVDYVTTAVRADMQRASATLADANARLQEAVRQAERRAKEFEALLSVAQEEAETTFVSTAAAVRGVRTGVGRLRDDFAEPAFPPSRRRRRGRRARLPLDAADLGMLPRHPVDEDESAGVYGADEINDADDLARAAADDELDDELDDALDVERGASAFGDFYDTEGTADGEDSARAEGTEERPRVRPRRGRRD